MGKVYVLRKSAEKHSRNMLLFTTIIIGSVFGLAACNNNANEETPLQDNNTINENGVNDNGTYNGTEGNGVINGVDTTNPNGVNENGTTNNNNINEGTTNNNTDTNPNNDSFKDEAQKAIDKTEDAIRGEDGNNKPE